jgi:phosphoglycolate phosphatase-like HAD superfamily hydrolase
MSKQIISVVITDLDNTLFDWFEVWYQSFNAMLQEILKDNRIPRDRLLQEIKQVHQKYGTSEYAFLLQELPLLNEINPNQDIAQVYSEAIHAYRSARLRFLKLYPGVMDTLKTLKEWGCWVIAFTESMGFYTSERLRRLELDGVIDVLYSPEDHDLPPGMTPEDIRKYPAEHYQLKQTLHKHTPKGALKPNAEVLLKIINDVGVSAENVIYIGDSLFKDVIMAKKAGVIDVYARYGKAHHKEEYELLRAVTHWTDDHVQEEKGLNENTVNPRYALDGGFSQLLALFNFTRYTGPLSGLPSDARIAQVIDIWKTTIAVQQHFNDLEIRIRSVAVPALAAIIGAAAITMKEQFFVVIGGWEVAGSFFIVFAGLIMWFSFWMMDRQWYHRLLYGAVKHGESIESNWEKHLPEISLTKRISAESPTPLIRNWKKRLREIWKERRIHSPDKINIFYGIGFCFLLALVFLFFFAKPISVKNTPEQEKPRVPARTGPGKTLSGRGTTESAGGETKPLEKAGSLKTP